MVRCGGGWLSCARLAMRARVADPGRRHFPRYEKFGVVFEFYDSQDKVRGVGRSSDYGLVSAVVGVARRHARAFHIRCHRRCLHARATCSPVASGTITGRRRSSSACCTGRARSAARWRDEECVTVGAAREATAKINKSMCTVWCGSGVLHRATDEARLTSHHALPLGMMKS